jgi:hypothetical protein
MMTIISIVAYNDILKWQLFLMMMMIVVSAIPTRKSDSLPEHKHLLHRRSNTSLAAHTGQSQELRILLSKTVMFKQLCRLISTLVYLVTVVLKSILKLIDDSTYLPMVGNLFQV